MHKTLLTDNLLLYFKIKYEGAKIVIFRADCKSQGAF